jgi:TIR domain
MTPIDRSVQGRIHRFPDIFLSHSSRDKDFVRKLAEDLAFCEVDAWLDEWELQVGDSLYDAITRALENSRFVAVILGDNYVDSKWAGDEMKQALARERREGRTVTLPLLCGNVQVPPFLEDKLYLDFRTQYFHGLVRLAALVHDVPRQHIEDAVRAINPENINSSINALRYAGIEPYVVMTKEDGEAILNAGGERYRDNTKSLTPSQLRALHEDGEQIRDDRVRFSPEKVAENPNVSSRLRRMMKRLIEEAW